MSYTKRALKGFVIVFVINILAAFLGYLIRIVLARNLSIAEYGLFFSVFTFVSLIGIFNGLGMGEALVKYIPEFLVKKKHDKIKSAVIIALLVTLATVFVVGILLLIFSGFLAKHYFRNELAVPLLLLFVIIMLISNLKGILKVIFQAFQNMKLYSSMYLAENGFLLVLLFCFFAFQKNVFIASYAYIATYLLILLIFIPLLFKVFNFFKHKASVEKELFNKLLRFGIPVTISGIGGLIIVYTDTLVLTYFRSMEEVGVYNVIVPTAMILQFFATSIATVIFPMVAELWARKKKQYLELGLKMLYQYSFAIILPAVLVVLAFSETVLRLMFGEGYVGGAFAMQILLLGIIFLGLHSITSTILGGIGQPAISTKILIQGAALNFLLNLLLIPRLGIIGAALTSLIAYFYVAIMCIFKLRHFIKVQIPWLNWLKIAFAGILMLGLIFALKSVLVLNTYSEAVICVILGGLFYLCMIMMMRIVDLREIKSLVAHILGK